MLDVVSPPQKTCKHYTSSGKKQFESKKLLPYNVKEAETIRILIVDDDPETAEEMAELLRDIGHNAEFSTNPEDAIFRIRESEDISIVITDLNMPDMTGLEMIEEIKAPLPAERDIAMIVVTGHADTRRAVKALQLGAMDFLAKPIDPDIFIHATDRAVESICLKRLEREFRKQLECRVFERTEEVQKLSSELLTANDVLMVKNAELEASNQIKSEFLTLISHELRTPLNAIIGFSSLIEMNNGQNENDGMVEYNRGILDSGNNLLRIINTILELIDVSSGDQKLNKTDLDINYLITRVVEVLKPKADEAGVEIILNLTIAPDFIYADSHSLTQVIGNILDNAIQFSANSGPVVITSLSNNDEVTITIADEGIGMTKDQMKIAEEPFRQVDSSLSKTAYGMGLGLPMSRLFVEMHGGRMNIHSSDGEGTIVDISLPKKSDHNE